MTNKVNGLFFFSDRWYTMPGDTYSYGVVGAKDEAEAKLMLGTELVNGLQLGTTDVSGQVVCASEIREITPRTKAEEREVETKFYRLKEDVDVSERVEQIRKQISNMYGIDCSGMTIDFTRALRIPGEYTSTGRALWQVQCKHPDFDDTQPIMLAAEGDGSITTDDANNFEEIGETEIYKYVENVPLALTPEWLIADILEKAGLGPDSWAILADVARKAAYSNVAVEGWAEVNEVYGEGANGHVFRWWLNPDWENLIRTEVTAVAGEREVAPPMNIAGEIAGDEPAAESAE